MPVTVPDWVVILTSVFSILFVKQMFGGIGSNFVNPALMGRLFAMVVWPGLLCSMSLPQPLARTRLLRHGPGSCQNRGRGRLQLSADVSRRNAGALGETSKLLLLVGFATCATSALSTWKLPLPMWRPYSFSPLYSDRPGSLRDILLNLFGGGLILGACFMLTDYVFVSRRDDPLRSHSRRHHCRHPHFQYLSGRHLLWNPDSQLPGGRTVAALQKTYLWYQESLGG